MPNYMSRPPTISKLIQSKPLSFVLPNLIKKHGQKFNNSTCIEDKQSRKSLVIVVVVVHQNEEAERMKNQIRRIKPMIEYEAKRTGSKSSINEQTELN